jgi:hypothetical protein
MPAVGLNPDANDASVITRVPSNRIGTRSLWGR